MTMNRRNGGKAGGFWRAIWQLRWIKFTPLVLLVPTLARQKTELFYITYSFFRETSGQGCSGIAVDALQCFPANCLDGGNNRLHVAV